VHTGVYRREGRNGTRGGPVISTSGRSREVPIIVSRGLAPRHQRLAAPRTTSASVSSRKRSGIVALASASHHDSSVPLDVPLTFRRATFPSLISPTRFLARKRTEIASDSRGAMRLFIRVCLGETRTRRTRRKNSRAPLRSLFAFPLRESESGTAREGGRGMLKREEEGW